MFNRLFKLIDCPRLGWVVYILSLLFFCGCSDLLNEKSGELESRATLNEIKKLSENPNAKNPLPEMYREAPKQMKVKDGVKIFYFTKHHPAEKLADMIRKQFSKMTTDGSGKTIYAPHYIVSSNSATNQLVIQCPNDIEANKVLEFLKHVDVPPIQVNIDCLIIERYADKTMDRETTIKVDNLLGEKITAGGKKDATTGKLLPNFPGASLREAKRSTFGLGFGYWLNKNSDSHEIRVLIDILESHGYLKILMNPKIETINGQTAKILSRDDVPIEKTVTQQTNVLPYSITEYQWVEDSLEVTPHVYADGSIGLSTDVKFGTSSKPKGVVQQSVITERSIHITENRIKPGNSLVIGGLKKTEKREVVRGAPILKDIPIIGLLFSSRDFEESGTELIFILTPSISSGGIPNKEMIEKVKKEHQALPPSDSLSEFVTDPFGFNASEKKYRQKALNAEQAQAEAEKKAAEAQNNLMHANEQAKKAKADAEKARADAEKAKAEAEKAKAEKDSPDTQKAKKDT